MIHFKRKTEAGRQEELNTFNQKDEFIVDQNSMYEQCNGYSIAEVSTDVEGSELVGVVDALREGTTTAIERTIEVSSTVDANQASHPAREFANDPIERTEVITLFEFQRGRVRRPIADVVLKPGRSLVVGRSRKCAVVLSGDRAASSRHSKLEFKKNGLRINDLHSTNGTFVNGKRVKQSKLKHGDKIRIGSCVFITKVLRSSKVIGDDSHNQDVRVRDKPTPQVPCRDKVWRLTCKFRSGKIVRRIVLKDGQKVSFGSSFAADCKIDDSRMQDLHFNLRLNGPIAYVENLSQRGATYFNGSLVHGEQVVRNGKISTGGSQFEIEVSGNESAKPSEICRNDSVERQMPNQKSSADTVEGC